MVFVNKEGSCFKETADPLKAEELCRRGFQPVEVQNAPKSVAKGKRTKVAEKEDDNGGLSIEV